MSFLTVLLLISISLLSSFCVSMPNNPYHQEGSPHDSFPCPSLCLLFINNQVQHPNRYMVERIILKTTIPGLGILMKVRGDLNVVFASEKVNSDKSSSARSKRRHEGRRKVLKGQQPSAPASTHENSMPTSPPNLQSVTSPSPSHRSVPTPSPSHQLAPTTSPNRKSVPISSPKPKSVLFLFAIFDMNF